MTICFDTFKMKSPFSLLPSAFFLPWQSPFVLTNSHRTKHPSCTQNGSRCPEKKKQVINEHYFECTRKSEIEICFPR